MAEIVLPSGLTVLSHTDKKQRKPVNYREAIASAQKLQQEQKSNDLWQHRCSAFMRTSGYVLASFMGDMHIGSIGTDYGKLMEYFELIHKTPNAFVGFGGDEVEQGFIFRDGGRSGIMTEQMQGNVAMEAMKELDEAGKVLYFGQGNHNNFVTNFYETFYGGFNAPLLGENTGVCDLQVNDTPYQIGIFHKISMGNSTMSPFLREQRAMEYWYPQADIVVGHHTHRKAIAQYNLGLGEDKKLRTLIEAGTMKLEDGFQRREGNLRMTQFDYTGAGVILNPDQRQMIPFYDLEEGVEQLQSLNGLRSILTATAGKTIARLNNR